MVSLSGQFLRSLGRTPYGYPRHVPRHQSNGHCRHAASTGDAWYLLGTCPQGVPRGIQRKGLDLHTALPHGWSTYMHTSSFLGVHNRPLQYRCRWYQEEHLVPSINHGAISAGDCAKRFRARRTASLIRIRSTSMGLRRMRPGPPWRNPRRTTDH